MDARELLRQAGFRGPALETAYAVMMAESGGRARAHNPNASTGDNSYGLFQINMLGALGPDRLKRYGLKSNEDLFNPAVNAKIAFQMSNGGKDWSPWSAYKNGSYKKYLKAGSKDIAFSDSGSSGARGDVQVASPVQGGQDAGRQALLSMMLQRNRAHASGNSQAGVSALQMLMGMRSASQAGSGVSGAPAAPGGTSATFTGDTGVKVTSKARKGALAEMFYDPLGGYDNGQAVKAIGGHGKHVHAAFNDPAAMQYAVSLAKKLGLRVGELHGYEKVDPVHTDGSFHYQKFGSGLGRAGDFSGDPRAMAEFFRTLARLYN